MAAFNALRLSGRFNVMRATRSRTANSMTSIGVKYLPMRCGLVYALIQRMQSMIRPSRQYRHAVRRRSTRPGFSASIGPRNALHMMIHVAILLLQGKQPFEVVPYRIFVRHPNSAMQLYALGTHDAAGPGRYHLGSRNRRLADSGGRVDHG